MKHLDITKHEFVPKHIILSEKKKEEVLKEYKIKLKQLPRISISDPVIKILNAKIGDVIKIIRKSETAGESEYYRVVTRGEKV